VSAGVLRSDDRGRVRLLTLARPKALNAFDDALYDALRDALRAAEADPEVAVVVVTGEGRAFSAGQDLGQMAHPVRHDDGEPHGFVPFMEVLESFSKPLLAAVNGVAVGIGVTMLPHCDLVWVAEGARLRLPFARLGVTVEAANSFLLPATVGRQWAARWLFTGGWIPAREAVEAGLAWRCVPGDALLDEVLAAADEMAAMPVDSLVATKRLMVASRLDAVRAARERENRSFARLVGGPANREALAAFREGREPDFSRLPASEPGDAASPAGPRGDR